ncbi:MAG: hypothetical protein WAZ14_00260 [Patescibacteria group bacterium]
MASLISIGQILDQSLEHGKKYSKELLAILLWIVIAAIPSIISRLIAPSDATDRLNTGDWISFGLSLSGLIITGVVSVWAYAVFILAVDSQMAKRKTDLKALYQHGWKIFWKYLALTISLVGVVIAAALPAILGVVITILGSTDNAPGFLAAIGVPLLLIGCPISIFLIMKYVVLFAFAPYLMVLEKKSLTNSFKESAKLVKGRWLAVAMRFIVPKLVFFLVMYLITAVVTMALSLLLGTTATMSGLLTLIVYAFSLLISVFLSIVTTPLIITTDYLLYDSLKKTR